METKEPVRGVGIDIDQAVELAMERYLAADSMKSRWDEGYLQCISDVKEIMSQMQLQAEMAPVALHRRWYDRVFERMTKKKSHAQKAGKVREEGQGEGDSEKPVGGVREEHGAEAPPPQEKTADPF